MALRSHRLGLLLGSPVLVALAGCGPSTPSGTSIELGFAARVNGEAFECGRSYPGVGTSDTTITAQDLRLYVHDVRFVTADGTEVPLALDQDDFQNGEIALLDFETGGSACGPGNAPTHTMLTGTLASAGPFTALRLRIGVPEDRNHLDSGSQPSPMNLSTLYWGWQGGYKFMRFEALTDEAARGVSFHLGATNCSGDATLGTRTCANGNRPEITLALPAGFSASSHEIVLDVGQWLAEMDLSGDGCESSATDPDCPAWNATVGLPDASAQRLLSVAAR
jgi:uncharacterized repeat protein (TIGR04052 family)